MVKILFMFYEILKISTMESYVIVVNESLPDVRAHSSECIAFVSANRASKRFGACMCFQMLTRFG